jgi:hypothetical protein
MRQPGVRAYPIPWPENRPPHMIKVRLLHFQQPLVEVIRRHQEICPECGAWAKEHSDDPHLWIYPEDDD